MLNDQPPGERCRETWGETSHAGQLPYTRPGRTGLRHVRLRREQSRRSPATSPDRMTERTPGLTGGSPGPHPEADGALMNRNTCQCQLAMISDFRRLISA